MPVQFGKSEDFLPKVLDQMAPDAPIVGPPIAVIKEPAPGFMNWEERLRTTEELLQKLSGGYPFTWHGDV